MTRRQPHSGTLQDAVGHFLKVMHSYWPGLFHLVPASVDDWQALRNELNAARRKRTLQRRFRQNPQAYLADLEYRLTQLILPL